MSTENTPAAEDVCEEAERRWPVMVVGYTDSDGSRFEYQSTENRALREAFIAGAALETRESVDWRVLGGVIPGPIPVEWVRVGDTIQDHGVTGTITRAVRSGRMVHLSIDSGHVSFAKVAQQDFVTVLSAGGE